MENGLKEAQQRMENAGQPLNTAEEKEAGRIFTKCLGAIQLIVANEIREVAGFKNPTGYELNNETRLKLQDLKDNAKDIGERALATAKIAVVLEDHREAMNKQKKKLEARNPEKTANKEFIIKSEADQQKYAILKQGIAAIDTYFKDFDANALSAQAKQLTEADNSRIKGRGKHAVSELVADLNNTINKITAIASPTVTSPTPPSVSRSASFKLKMFDQGKESPPESPRSDSSLGNKGFGSKR